MAKIYMIALLIFLPGSRVIAQELTATEIKNNRIKKISIRSITKGQTDTLHSIYYYDENGYDTANYSNGERKYYRVVSYNRKLQPLTITKFFPDGTEIDKTVFTYKPDGSFMGVNTDKMYGMKVTEAYDKKGHRLSFSIPDGTVIKYSYNANGQLMSSSSNASQGEKKRTTKYIYNKTGKLASSVNTGEYNSKTMYEYNGQGLLKMSTRTSVSQSGEKYIATQEYEYGY